MLERLWHLFDRPQPPRHDCAVRGCDKPATREDHYWHIRTCDDHVGQMRTMSKTRATSYRPHDDN